MKRVIGRHKAFLEAFVLCGSISKAAKAAGVHRGQHYEWLHQKEGYRAEFEQVCNEAADIYQDEAVRRAYEGVFVPNVYQGKFVYPSRTKVDPKTGETIVVKGRKPLGIVKYSDKLLIFLLKGLRPERYREDRVVRKLSGVVKMRKFEGSMEELLATYWRLTADKEKK